MRSIYEKKIIEGFMNLCSKHAKPEYCYDELDWLVFTKHKDEFDALDEATQWEIREIMFAFKKIYK